MDIPQVPEVVSRLFKREVRPSLEWDKRTRSSAYRRKVMQWVVAWEWDLGLAGVLSSPFMSEAIGNPSWIFSCEKLLLSR